MITSIMQQDNTLDTFVQLLLLLIAILLVAVFLYISLRLITGKKETETGYIIRLLLVAAIIVILVALVIGAVVGVIGGIPVIGTAATQLVPILSYIAIVYLIKYILIPERGELTKWTASIWGALIALFLIYLVNAFAVLLDLPPLIPTPV